ncbi:MAG: CIA30 family protein, partial [Elusimicrobia bacterium]|nr:CIA30 family protein [Elusimicrobiota bacterium]
ADYVDLGTEWRKIKIPLKEFQEVDLTSLDNINLGFSGEDGEGQIYLDDFQFEVPEVGEEERALTGKFSNKVLIDSFERPNPTDVYLIYEGDDSSLKLNSSRIVKEGNYSMELEYTLSTTRPWGSWVAARWQSRETTLDWQGAQDIKLWVKGDGSDNIFKFSLIDADGEKWTIENDQILKSTVWEMVQIPIDQLELDEKSAVKNEKIDLEQVRAYEMTILGSGGSKNTSGVKTSVGKIQVDHLYVSGEQISSVWAVPTQISEKTKLEPFRIGNIELNGQVFTEFLHAPEQRSTVNHFGKIIANGKVKNFSAKIEWAAETQEFGDAARFNVAESTASGTTATTQSSKIQEVNLQLFANNLSPYLTQVTLGNIFVDYSPFTFSPVFGFKGISAEGDVDTLNYHLFAIKHKYDSFTGGSRLKFFWKGFRVTGIGVYFSETAKINSAGSLGQGTINTSSDLQLKEVQNDLVTTLQAERPLWRERVTLGGTLGYNRYNQLATADRSSPFDPVFGNALQPPLDVNGKMFRGKIALHDLYLPGFKTFYEYRSVDTEFKPRYRQSPISFDDSDSDQRGHNIRIVEGWRGFLASLEYDTMKRASNDTYDRNRWNWGVGYYGFHKLDLAFNQEIRRETYAFVSNRTGVSYSKNERVTVSEIYVRAQLTPRMIFFFKPKREDIEHPQTGLTFANESIYGKLEFFATTNLKIQGEFRTTHFGVKDFEPKGFPYDDNFVRTNIEFNF